MSDDPLARLESEHHSVAGTRLLFQEQLAGMDAALVEVATEVGDAILPVTRAFLEADAHTAMSWINALAQVGRRCPALEERCYEILALQAPVAGDLRRVVAVLRCVADVQRSAALLRHVAESLTWVHPPSMPEDMRTTIAHLGAVSADIFGRAIEAWRRHDGLAASELMELDDQVDLLHKILLTDLYTGQQSMEEAVSLALVARYYERIADHGVEMARQVTYFLTGDRVEG